MALPQKKIKPLNCNAQFCRWNVRNEQQTIFLELQRQVRQRDISALNLHWNLH